MLALGTNFYPFAPRADEVFQRGVQIQRIAHLVKVGHLQIRTLANLARRRLQFTQNQFQQCGFARTIGADQAYFVATQQGGAEMIDHPFVAKINRNIGQFSHNFSAGQARVHTGPDLTHSIASGKTCGAKFFQTTNPRDRPCSSRFNASSHPHLFLRQQFVGLGLGHRFCGYFGFFQEQIALKIALVRVQMPAVQLHDAGRHLVQKSPVVGDDKHTAFELHQQVLQPLNTVQIQMVGRLVQKQNVGQRHQRLPKRYPLARAPREASYQSRAV